MTTHRRTGTPEYYTWSQMKRRCNSPKVSSYSRYGGRGITYDPSWEYFENFYRDMGPRPEGMSIHRIDNDGNYGPDNCKWATDEEQANATSFNLNITYNGKTQTATQWSKELGIDRRLVYKRIETGWNPIDALLLPVGTINNPQEKPFYGIPCIHCHSLDVRKNGHKKGRQYYFCRNCSRNFS